MGFRSIAAAASAGAVLCAVGTAEGAGFRVTGGYHRIAYADYNDFADGINDLIAGEPTLTGELNNIHWIPELAFEATFPIVPMLSIGAGGGMLRGSSDFELSFNGATFSFEHTVKAYPITGTLYAEIPVPLGPAKPYAFAGGGAYYTKVTFKERFGDVGGITGYDADLTKWGFGLHGGAGLSFAVAPMASIDIGIRARYAKIAGFEGTATSTDGETADIVLGIYRSEEGYMIYGPVGADEAAGADEGSVDLSGYGFAIGFTVSF